MEKNVKITVSGPTASGKSTISQIIKRALDFYGIKSEVLNEDCKHPEENLVEKCKIFENKTIQIDQVQTVTKFNSRLSEMKDGE